MNTQCFFLLTEHQCAQRNLHHNANVALHQHLIHRRVVIPHKEPSQQTPRAQGPAALINNPNGRRRDPPQGSAAGIRPPRYSRHSLHPGTTVGEAFPGCEAVRNPPGVIVERLKDVQ
ncbi:uncharacterized [Tachysurus ichikawai]